MSHFNPLGSDAMTAQPVRWTGILRMTESGITLFLNERLSCSCFVDFIWIGTAATLQLFSWKTVTAFDNQSESSGRSRFKSTEKILSCWVDFMRGLLQFTNLNTTWKCCKGLHPVALKSIYFSKLQSPSYSIDELTNFSPCYFHFFLIL